MDEFSDLLASLDADATWESKIYKLNRELLLQRSRRRPGHLLPRTAPPASTQSSSVEPESSSFWTTHFDPTDMNVSSSTAPIAYGYVAPDGKLCSGTPNVSVTWSDADGGRYEITISGEYYVSSEYVTVVTPTSGPILSRVDSANGKLLVYFYNLQGDQAPSYFQFITYKP